MSAKVSGAVWEMDLPMPVKYVLLALAEHANHEGEHIHPGIDLIAWKTGYSVRHVKRVLRELEDLGVIVADLGAGGGRGIVTEYRIDLDAGPRLPPRVRRKRVTSATPNDAQPSSKKGDIPAQMPLDTEKGDMAGPKRVTPVSEKGDIPLRAHVDKPLTVINRHLEPSPPTPPGGAPEGIYRSLFGDEWWGIVTEFKAVDPVLGNGWLGKGLQRAPPGLTYDALCDAVENALNRIADDFKRDDDEHFITKRYGWAAKVLAEELADAKGMTA